MFELCHRMKWFLKSEDGVTAVEYAVMLGLILLACVATIQAVGGNVNVLFEETRDEMPH